MGNSRSLTALKILIVTLVTSLTITGISFLDDQIWNIVMVIVGLVAYGIVGLLFSIGLISGKKAGKEAYAAVFIILLILGYCVYEGIISFQQWIVSWPLMVKILIPSIIGFLLIGTIAIFVINKRKSKILNNDAPSNDKEMQN